MKGNIKKTQRNLNSMIGYQNMMYEFSYFSKKKKTKKQTTKQTTKQFVIKYILASKFSRYAVNCDNFDPSDNYQGN